MAGFMEAMRAAPLAEEAYNKLCHLVDIAEDLADEVTGSPRVDFMRSSAVVNLDATGAGVAQLRQRAGVETHLISYAGQSSVDNQGVAGFYLDQSLDPTTLIAVAPLALMFGDPFQEGDRVPAGRDLWVNVVGGPANGWVVVNLAAKQFTEPTHPLLDARSES